MLKMFIHPRNQAQTRRMVEEIVAANVFKEKKFGWECARG